MNPLLSPQPVMQEPQPSIREFLAQLRTQGVVMWPEGERLRFSAPKECLTPEFYSALAARKVEIMHVLADDAAPAPASLPACDHASPCISFAQQRLWFLHQLAPDSPVYNIPLLLDVRRVLQIAVLQRALTEIVRRHSVLRAVYVPGSNPPRLHVQPPYEVALPLISLTESDRASRRSRAQALAEAAAREPFDLEHGPLLRAHVWRLEPEQHLLLISLHHSVSDGWSSGVLLSELGSLYSALVRGQTMPLAPLPIQYADYAHAQRAALQGPALDEQLGYWKQQLADSPALLTLPSDRPRRGTPRFQGALAYSRLPADLVGELQALSRRAGVTLFMTLLAAFQGLLARYSGQHDIVVGAPIAGRTEQATEGLIGCFINTLALRTDLSGDPSFMELLKRVRETALEAYAHQELPFDKLVEALQPERNLSHTPFFQTVFVLHNTPQEGLHFTDLSVTALPIHTGTAKFDLSLAATETPAGLDCELEYNTDLFDATTAERLLGHFRTLLDGIVADPTQRLGQLPLLTPAERTALLAPPAPPAAAPSTTLTALFEAQAVRRPQAIAAVYEEQRLSYHDLNTRANQLAHYLQQQGVGPEQVVGLCLERGPDLLIGLLAILKAGGAYLPLDPGYPPERLAFMLADSQVRLVITHSSLGVALPADRSRLCLDQLATALAAQPGANPVTTARPEQLAYIIYTSGSTGKPKGVMITQANVLRLFTATEPWFHFTEHDVWTLFHSYAFDFSVWEIWGALLYGGTLVIVPYAVSRAPEAFYQLLHQEGVTVLNQTPSAFRQLSHAEQQLGPQPLALRYIIFGGEALELQSLKPWLARHGDSAPQLINMYGITETTVHVTYRRITLEDVEAQRGSVIGVPIPDLQAYLLDQYGQPVPIGVPGEIHVGGAGLARGYLNRPELSAARFIPHPFSDVPGQRLYKSGDLARYLNNGELDYLGRIDQQVKLRGFRIELGEIEAALSQHAGVREAVVLLREDSPGDQRLVGYWTGQGDPLPSTQDLRQHLKTQLPDYMVPSNLVWLEALPLTANGKVDQRALPRPEDHAERELAYVPPATLLEQSIASVWQEVLQVEQVGREDNFFDLGGHSMLMVRVHSRLRELLGKEISVIQLFQYPTVRALAQCLSQAGPLAPTAALAGVIAHAARQKAAQQRHRHEARRV
ncbi:MAG TPA: amino acid adenylation domain-containing protein [Gammaproteobacteria bacterium]|nr:amino acid adenylation domain-containing protein [Gammaproteobacteria bacterium]